jgi:predicted acetyltransferase
MTTIEQMTEKDVAGACRLWSFCFDHGKARERTFEQITTEADGFVAKADGQFVGAYINRLLDMSYDGQFVPIGAIAAVGTELASRGSGVARAMMQHAVRHNREIGRPVSMLYPFSVKFYRDLGWELAGTNYFVSLGLKDVRPGPETDRVRAVTATEFDSVYDRFAQRYRGCMKRTPYIWERVLKPVDGEHRFMYVYEGDAGPEGFMHFCFGSQYYNDELQRPGEVFVRDLIALTPAAHRGLVGTLARLKMQVERVCWEVPADDPVFFEPYDHNRVATLTSERMFRVVDAEKLLARPSEGPVSGEYTIRIMDDEWAGGPQTYLVRLEDGTPRVFPSSATPSIEMTQRAFAQCWVGDPSAEPLRRAGHIQVHDDNQFGTFRSHFGPGTFMTCDPF